LGSKSFQQKRRCPKPQSKNIQALLSISRLGTDEQIGTLFESLKTPLELTSEKSLPYVFIIDKEGNLRGRDDDEDVGTLFGFNAQSVAEINNKMVDDIKVILAEYRRAWKKYNKE
jgi:hypothetical protein